MVWEGFSQFYFRDRPKTLKKTKTRPKIKNLVGKNPGNIYIINFPKFRTKRASGSCSRALAKFPAQKIRVLFPGIRLNAPNYNGKPNIAYVKSTSPGWEIGENWIFFVEEGRQSSTTTPPVRFG